MNAISCFADTSFPFVDEFGKPVKKTKYSHPYSYDGFVQEDLRAIHGQADSTVWTDRLLQWNYKNTRRLLHKYFWDGNMGSDGDYWSNRPAAKIEKFLSEYFRKKVKVVLVMNYCNQSSDHPTWRIDFKYVKKDS